MIDVQIDFIKETPTIMPSVIYKVDEHKKLPVPHCLKYTNNY